MTSLVRILSVQTIDSSPSLVLVSPNGRKTLVNCGEGCQRIFLEFAQKISSVDRVCLTHLSPDAMAGLPGMILTAADVNVTQLAAAKAAMEAKRQKSEGSKNGDTQQKANHTPLSAPKEDTHDSDNENNNPLPGLQLIGPTGTKAFVRSLRHFMRRDCFFMDIQEGAYKQTPAAPANNNNSQKKRKKSITKKQQQQQLDQDAWLIQSIVSDLDSTPNNGTTDDTAHNQQSTAFNAYNTSTDGSNVPQHRRVLSFLFTTPPVLGKFRADKAKELGVPRGPLFGQLKNGATVTFPDPHDESKTVTVESHQVVEPSSPGIVVAVLYYPTVQVLEQLQQSSQLRSLQWQQKSLATTTTAKNGDNVLEMMVHMAPRDVFHSDAAKTWRSSFGDGVQHLFMPTEATCIEQKVLDNVDEVTKMVQSLTPFHSASIGTWMRSQIAPDIYSRPSVAWPDDKEDHSPSNRQPANYADAIPLLEYVVIPRKSRGFQNQNAFLKHWKNEQEDARLTLAKSKCMEKVQKQQEGGSNSEIDKSQTAQILFTGTGSAIPCQDRNVSGIHVRMDNGNGLLLDCGEGTIGQLLRAFQQNGESNGSDGASVLRNIKAVWISHPHADHHLGILRLLEEKKKQRLVNDCDSLILIAPPCLHRFLMEYEKVDPDIVGSYEFLDCRSLVLPQSLNGNAGATPEPNKDLLHRLEHELEITSCEAIPVAHCRDSFAVVFHGTSFGSIAYSGDCRPSMVFAERAKNADILIHEATFADGLEADAVLKKHCTVSEALNVGKKMNAKTVILTHFSQRYPSIPPLSTETGDTKIIFAFDFQMLSPSSLTNASQVTPILRMLYPEKVDEMDDGNDLAGATATAGTMDIPGLFAQNELL